MTAAMMLWSAFLIARIREPKAPDPHGVRARKTSLRNTRGFSLARPWWDSKRSRSNRAYDCSSACSSRRPSSPGLFRSSPCRWRSPPSASGCPAVGFLNMAFGIGALGGASRGGGNGGHTPPEHSVHRRCGPVGAADRDHRDLAATRRWPMSAWGWRAFGNTLVDVAGFTLVERAVPNAILARVVGVMQMLWLTAMGVGAVVTPVFINRHRSRVGADRRRLLPARAAHPLRPAARPHRRRRVGSRSRPARAPSGHTDLCRAARHFAGGACRTPNPRPISTSGTQIITEGEAGDRFYLVASGTVDVSAPGRPGRGGGAPGRLLRGDRAPPRRPAYGDRHRHRRKWSSMRWSGTTSLPCITSHVPSRETAESVAAARLTDLRGAVGRLPVPNF